TKMINGAKASTGEMSVTSDQAAQPQVSSTTARPAPAVVDPRWRQQLARLLFCVDTLSIVAALVVAYLVRFGPVAVEIRGINYVLLSAVLLVSWLCMLVTFRAYEPRLLGIGTEEYRRVLGATFALIGFIAVISYLGKLEISRGFVGLFFPIGLVLLLLARFALRAWIRSARRRGELCHRVLVVGDPDSALALSTQLERESSAGFAVVGLCLAGLGTGSASSSLVPVHEGVDQVMTAAAATGADTVAVSSSPHISSEDLRRIAWSLEGSGIDLVVAPAVTEVAGPRISIRPVAGLPLLYVDEPRFTGTTRVMKRGLDLFGSGIGLLLLSPLLVGAAIAIRLTSGGPAVFRQTRIGQDGREFRVVKLRTMYQDAEQRRAEFESANETDGLLFKMADDPRITPVGRLLRRTSVDELPQLVNVLIGDMSLVGPRPLPVKDSDFAGHVRRRLLVRPGITGLWQVSGRSNLSWDDSVRLDLYYVENWSLSMDLTILAKTVQAVWRADGAY
ncbi:MAG TPA: sugar transferase, partial [Actinomycetes bacterium]|nr:sugar transferase [Actinomycetes bacterium]